MIRDMDELYERMKDAIRMFGLHWSQKEEIDVFIEKDKINFHHENAYISFTLVNKNDPE